jgi:hypothetical protein
MSKLEALRITECPAAFASFAQKHNALVDLVASAVGAAGIKVTVSEKNIVVATDPTTLGPVIDFLVGTYGPLATRISDIGYEAAAQYASDESLVTEAGFDTLWDARAFSQFNGLWDARANTEFSGLWDTRFAAVTNEANYDVCISNVATSITFIVKA